MKKIIYLFISATLISFLGSLPIGTLNITITKLSIHQDYFSSISFASGAILVELVVVKVSLTVIVQLVKMKTLLKIFHYSSIILLFSFAIYFFRTANQSKAQDVIFSIELKNMFLWGALISLLNPLHLPFWMAWSSILKSKGLLSMELIDQIIYLFAIAFGTGLAYYLYFFVGSELIQYFKDETYLINIIIGITLIITAAIQLLKFHRKSYS